MSVRSFAKSEVRWKAYALFGALLTLMLAVNGLNVWNSYVGRNFITAIEAKNVSNFIKEGWLYFGVFALSTVVAVVFRFVEERLGLLWREWQTRRLLAHYLANRVYLGLHHSKLVANPDQNIAEDVKAFTSSTLSFVLMILNGTFTAVAFSSVLWSISPTLFGVAVAYASVGTLFTVLLGRRLVGLTYRQFDCEAEFRAELVHVRGNAESIALLGREEQLRTHLMEKLGSLVTNWRHVIAVNRNLGFFTTGYNYMIQLIPALIVARLFIDGKAEFGVITQSAMAFAQLMGAFSIIVTQFQSISTYTAVSSRLGNLVSEMQVAAKHSQSMIEVCEDCGLIGYENLTLCSPDSSTILVNNLTLQIPRGMNVLIDGHHETAKMALFRATAGIWDHGTGKVIRPATSKIAFLTERPYLHPGTLRETLGHMQDNGPVSDEEIIQVLRLVGLESLVAESGGLDTEQDWNDQLSLGKQQLVAVARLLLSSEEFAVMDRIATALSPTETEMVLSLLKQKGITFVTFGNSTDNPAQYDGILDIDDGGSWHWQKEPQG